MIEDSSGHTEEVDDDDDDDDREETPIMLELSVEADFAGDEVALNFAC